MALDGGLEVVELPFDVGHSPVHLRAALARKFAQVLDGGFEFADALDEFGPRHVFDGHVRSAHVVRTSPLAGS